jgi:hypothetical protein
MLLYIKKKTSSSLSVKLLGGKLETENKVDDVCSKASVNEKLSVVMF